MNTKPENNKDNNQIEQIEKKVKIQKPKKADFRMHAHVNPLNETLFPYPLNYNQVDWSLHYPKKFGKDPLKLYLNTLEYPITYDDQVNPECSQSIVDFLDIGCGFGGLCFALGDNYPDKYTFGMEIRGKVVNFVGEKIRALRNEGQAHNVSVIRTNTMRHLPQYFRKNSLEKIFICFPDPHFKKKNYRRRIVNPGLLSEYAYLLKSNGRIYCITDVEELHNWHVQHLEKHKMFKRVQDVEQDSTAKLIWNSTEEGQKVERNKGSKFIIVCEKV
ncbi:unnamed protein product [Paramecium pentaurelia]|uniref:tRNA (guanine-N(7)-)-methyltransferase n=1 Tax=Paramecium pentaurelia TaxID=43138 RepID=A0A8S1TUS9_9CILI|nr:unnamed protein product [Paramecium pentaurelia]